MGHSESDIKKLFPEATVKSGLAVTGNYASNAGASVKKWLSENGLL